MNIDPSPFLFIIPRHERSTVMTAVLVYTTGDRLHATAAREIKTSYDHSYNKPVKRKASYLGSSGCRLCQRRGEQAPGWRWKPHPIIRRSFISNAVG